MTLIASYSIAQYPSLLGDLLISRWHEIPPEEAHFNVPTHTDVNSVLPREWGLLAVALRQKVIVISDSLVIAWTGSQFAARLACQELENVAQSGSLSIDQVKATLDSLELAKLELGLLGLLVVPVALGRHACYRFGWQQGQWIGPAVFDGSGAPVYAMGSGSEDFLATLRPALESTRVPETQRPDTVAILNAAAVVGMLSGEQIRWSRGLVGAEMYGGGFEVATIVDGSVTKVGGITYYFLDVLRLEDGRCMASFRRAISYEYDKELLHISTIELRWQCTWSDRGVRGEVEAGTVVQGEPAVYVVAPVHRDIEEVDRRILEASPPRPTFTSRYTVFYVHLPQNGGTVRTIAHYGGPEKSAFRIDLEGQEAVIELKPELLARLARHL